MVVVEERVKERLTSRALEDIPTGSIPSVDLSAQRQAISGCTDALATNFVLGATALLDCIYMRRGCTQSLAINFDVLATVDDGHCQVALVLAWVWTARARRVVEHLGVLMRV